MKIAMLGAARIGKEGLVKPAQKVEGIELYAIAARDPARARAYADKHHIPTVHDSYEALLVDPDVDAIYNPLPNGLHCEWSIKALEAGKHVLCEKPLASNAQEARAMAEAAVRCDRVLMEALHYRFHPMAARMQEAVAQLGRIQHIETSMCAPILSGKDIRYNYALGGGAAMDMGVYTISLLRFLAAAATEQDLTTTPQLDSVKVKLRGENIDRAMKVDLSWPGGCTGKLHYSLLSTSVLKLSARVTGEHGELRILNPYMPHLFHNFELRLGKQKTREKIPGEATYTCQLREFMRRIDGEEPRSSDLADSIATMAIIDAIYEHADMPLRGSPE
ncbi:MAG: Gfo/Idh/MocA family oxidoreductase [Halioglobus sp.]